MAIVPCPLSSIIILLACRNVMTFLSKDSASRFTFKDFYDWYENKEALLAEHKKGNRPNREEWLKAKEKERVKGSEIKVRAKDKEKGHDKDKKEKKEKDKRKSSRLSLFASKKGDEDKKDKRDRRAANKSPRKSPRRETVAVTSGTGTIGRSSGEKARVRLTFFF